MNEAKIKVSGMNCNHCKIIIENGISKIHGIELATADIVNGEVTIKGKEINLEEVKDTIEDLGYTYSGEL